MKRDDVEAVVSEIQAYVGDVEGAHQKEDELYRDVLRAIADGSRDAMGLAASALKTQEIIGERWYS